MFDWNTNMWGEVTVEAHHSESEARPWTDISRTTFQYNMFHNHLIWKNQEQSLASAQWNLQDSRGIFFEEQNSQETVGLAKPPAV